ncbi:hypothetical protein D4764_22G0003180 [Takifugu flavidus]|uniref:Uncharacterized protein n=1 Tax=Takifugu flavidus TaxID=433684 RepID=A0A5C6NDT5_9TELE|nr:hypothetical protein D4764_22G0003180 [Takifugu flavidus]
MGEEEERLGHRCYRNEQLRQSRDITATTPTSRGEERRVSHHGRPLPTRPARRAMIGHRAGEEKRSKQGSRPLLGRAERKELRRER